MESDNEMRTSRMAISTKRDSDTPIHCKITPKINEVVGSETAAASLDLTNFCFGSREVERLVCGDAALGSLGCRSQTRAQLVAAELFLAPQHLGTFIARTCHPSLHCHGRDRGARAQRRHRDDLRIPR